MIVQADPRFQEKVAAMTAAIIDAWPDDHAYPIEPPKTDGTATAAMTSIHSAIYTMAEKMAVFILYGADIRDSRKTIWVNMLQGVPDPVHHFPTQDAAERFNLKYQAVLIRPVAYVPSPFNPTVKPW